MSNNKGKQYDIEVFRWTPRKKLNISIEEQEKKLNISIGQVVTHIKSPLGIGLVVERRDEPLSYKVLWPKAPKCNLFICAEYLRPAQ